VPGCVPRREPAPRTYLGQPPHRRHGTQYLTHVDSMEGPAEPGAESALAVVVAGVDVRSTLVRRALTLLGDLEGDLEGFGLDNSGPQTETLRREASQTLPGGHNRGALVQLRPSAAAGAPSGALRADEVTERVLINLVHGTGGARRAVDVVGQLLVGPTALAVLPLTGCCKPVNAPCRSIDPRRTRLRIPTDGHNNSSPAPDPQSFTGRN
jgi:hypothetical protein